MGTRSTVHPLSEVHSAMLENTRPLEDISIQPPGAVVVPQAPERVAAVWVSRVTGIISALFVLIALALWASRHGHYRLVLAFLVVAMFAAILHSYTFENGSNS